MIYMNSVHDLEKSLIIEDHMSYKLLISLLDQIFGKHDDVHIDMSNETKENHDIIKLHWRTIRQYYKVPSCVKNREKLVRQTFMQIVNRLNEKHKFANPIRFDRHKEDYYSRETKVKKTLHWNELHLV